MLFAKTASYQRYAKTAFDQKKKMKERNRAVASLSLLVRQDKNISSIFPHFPVVSLIFPQNFFIFFLILVFRVGKLPTREGPGYTTGKKERKQPNSTFLGLPLGKTFYDACTMCQSVSQSSKLLVYAFGIFHHIFLMQSWNRFVCGVLMPCSRENTM